MTAKPEDFSFVHEAGPELIAMAAIMRPKWPIELLEAAMHGAHNAGWPWVKTFRAVTRLLLIADSGPYDLTEEVKASLGYARPSGPDLPAEYMGERFGLGHQDGQR